MLKKLAGIVSAMVAAALAVLPAQAQFIGFPFTSPFGFTSTAFSNFAFSSSFSSFGFGGFSPFGLFGLGGFGSFFSPFGMFGW